MQTKQQTTSEAGGDVGRRFNQFLVILYITDRSKPVLLIWLSVFADFGVSFCTVFTFCVSR